MSIVDHNRTKKHKARRRSIESATPDFSGGIQLVPPRYFAFKGLLDRMAAALLLIPGLPMIAVLVVLVRLTSRGPGIFRQSRVGQGGRVYMMYKIRTMRQDAEATTGPVWTQVHHDPRITFLGRILRKLHLDELPQLFNVLKGEMSLIGPRPERPEFVKVLAREIPGYLDRLAVPPGITGLAQINLPPDTDLDSVRRKLILDVEYIQTAGVGLDFRMFLSTFARLFGLPGYKVMRLLGLRRKVTLPTDNGKLSHDGPVTLPVSLKSILEHIEKEHKPHGIGHSNGNGHTNGNGHGSGNGHAHAEAAKPLEVKDATARRPK